jgi:hypothetical protein
LDEPLLVGPSLERLQSFLTLLVVVVVRRQYELLMHRSATVSANCPRKRRQNQRGESQCQRTYADVDSLAEWNVILEKRRDLDKLFPLVGSDGILAVDNVDPKIRSESEGGVRAWVCIWPDMVVVGL